ncbi:hypothetical protein [Thermus thermamylovorans]|uniref:Uncharacterized protein n=1 Tax=Thermus thermamylovorans TaxID=2509362 RepID=A0A4Q9B8H2_9DEIN|nr:hypothetical protein [Thermus thermamylovorans]TBH21178.1 hypothetical protein ETP66_03400 [Thermus thermamylovorans]
MSQAQAFARRVRRVVLNRQGTEAQVFLEAGFLYLRQDGFARFAQGEGAEALAGFALERGGVRLRFGDGSALTLRHRLGRLRKRVYFS